MNGLAFGESPRWHDGRLWFCNWGTGEIIALDQRGKGEVVITLPVTLPYCIDWLADGRLLVVSGPEARILRRETDGRLVTHADLAGISRQPWNEIVVDGRGSAYVNGGGFEPDAGIIALVTAGGTARQVADRIAFANGMAVTPDNATLIVAESWGKRLTAFSIAADGSLSGRRVWAELDGHPDGICIDSEGAVWYADVPNTRCVRVAEGGKVLHTVALDRGCFSCALGGEDRRTLFIVAAEWHGFDKMMNAPRTGQVLAVRAPAPAAGWP